MAKIKNEFRCCYCGRQIEYGSPDAILYDDNWYCYTDCLLGDLNIEADPWADEYEYAYTEDDTNGFGSSIFAKTHIQTVVTSYSEPRENPERFEEAQYYGEGLCGEIG